MDVERALNLADMMICDDFFIICRTSIWIFKIIVFKGCSLQKKMGFRAHFGVVFKLHFSGEFFIRVTVHELKN